MTTDRKKDILTLEKDPMQGLEHKLLSAEKFLQKKKKRKENCLILQCNNENTYLFANSTEVIKSKSTDPEVLPHPL